MRPIHEDWEITEGPVWLTQRTGAKAVHIPVTTPGTLVTSGVAAREINARLTPLHVLLSRLTEITCIRGSANRGARTRTVRVVSRRHTAIDRLPPMAAAQTPPRTAKAHSPEH